MYQSLEARRYIFYVIYAIDGEMSAQLRFRRRRLSLMPRHFLSLLRTADDYRPGHSLFAAPSCSGAIFVCPGHGPEQAR